MKFCARKACACFNLAKKFGGAVGISLNLSETWRPKEYLRLDADKDHAKLSSCILFHMNFFTSLDPTHSSTASCDRQLLQEH